tara:strand:+ start:310 stop:1215 length:906 start_codon:yes stop_codon:yes gene_type:complete
MVLPNNVNIYEVGARDGLQNEYKDIKTDHKIDFINKLSECGFKFIEATSFVSPKWIPQMGDNKDVMANIKRRDNVNYPVLTPNLRGLNDAILAESNIVCVFATASETFSKKNTNTTISQTLDNAFIVTERALNKGLKVRGYISCVLGCPYEGKISFNETAQIAKKLIDMGCYEVSLGDTVGFGTPIETKQMIEAVIKHVEVKKLAAHFHDTYGQALANLYVALELGVATIDSSIGGLGGCPYAEGAKGNVATEDVLYMLKGMGIHTGIDLNKVIKVSWHINKILGREPNSRVALALKRNNI